jgi:autotransporter-associated beta strand protein
MNSKPLFTSVLLIRIPVLLALAAGGVLVPHARAADSSWNATVNGNWSTAGNWTNGVPGATSGNTSTDNATFSLTQAGARIITVDANRNIGGITFSNTSAFGYTLSGGTLILSNGGVIQTAAANGAHTDTISTGMTLAGNATFMANATNASSLLSIAAVTGSATTGNTATLTLNGSNTGNNSITGIIGNGAGGGKLAIVKSDAGTWRLSGVNTFTGGLTLNSGMLQLGDNAALGGSGNVFTINGGVINVTAARTTTNNNAQNWNGDFTFLGSNTLNLGTGAVAMNATRTVTVDASTLTVGGVISGSGFGLTKAGAGTLTLSGANTFTGPVTINSGTLTVTSAIGNGSVAGGLGQATSAASNLVINGGTFNWNAAATATSDRGITIGTNGGTIFANGSGGSAGLRLTGPLALSGSGPRTITLVSVANGRENTWSADIGDSGGATTLSVNNTTASGTSSWMLNGNLTFTGGLSVGGGGGTLYLRGNQNNFSGGVSVGAGSALYFTNNNTMTFSQDVSNNGTFGFSGVNAGLSSVSNITGAIITISGLLSGNGSVSHSMSNNGRIIQSNPSNSYTGNTTTAANSAGLTLQVSKLANGGQNSSIGASSSAAGNLVLGSNVSPGTSILDYVGTGDSTDRLFTIKSNSGGGAGIYNNGSGALNFTNTGAIAFGTANMAATFFLGGSSAGYNTFAPILNNNGSGVVSLTKSNVGTWVLTGANTYTGNTTISAGTLVFQNTSAKSSGSNVTVAAAGTLGLGVGNNATDYSDHAANIFNNNGNGTFTLNATSGIALDTTNGNFTLSTALTANRALTKLGANTLTLNATNTYASVTTINGGTLSIATITDGGVAGALGNSTNAVGNLVLGGGTLEYTGSGNSTDRNFTLTAGRNSTISVTNAAATLTISGAAASTNGSLTKSGAGTLTLTGNNLHSGNTTVAAGTLLLTGNGTLGTSTISISGGTLDMGGKSLTNTFGSLTGGTLANGTLTNNGSNYDLQSGTVSAVLAGTNGVNKTTSGTVTLTGNNTFTGTTTLSAGTLQVGHANALGTSGNITFSGGTMQFTSNGSGADYGSRIKNSASTMVLDTNGQSVTFSGAIDSSNIAGLTKNGTGTLTLSGANSYTGGTTINAGTVTLSGASGALGSGTVAVGSSAALELGNSGTPTVSNNISGSGTIRQTGAGTTTLAGTNTNSGAVEATAGTLLFSGAGALSASTSSLNASNSATLSFADGTTLNSTITGNINLSGSSFLEFDINGASSDFLSTTGTALLTGSGKIQLNLSNAPTSGTTYDLLYAGGGLTSNWTLDTSSFVAGAFTWSLSTNVTNTLQLVATASQTNTYWTGSTSGDWSALANWAGGANGTGNGTVPTTGFNVFFDSATPTGNLTTTLGGANYTISTLAISKPEVAINGSNTLNVTTSALTAITISATGNTTINANLTGAAGLTKSGTGTLTLGGSNTYTGGTSITGGTVIAGSSTAFGNSTGAVTLNPGTGNTITLQSGAASLSISNNFTLSSGTAAWDTNSNDTTLSGAISGSGALTKNGLGNLTLAGQNTYTAATTINAGTLTLSGGLNNSSVTVNGGELNQTSTGTIAGTGATFTLAIGNATLAGNNAYIGATTISAGTLQIGAGSTTGSLSTSSAITNNGTLAFNRTNTITQGTDFASVISGTGNLIQAGSGNLVLSGNNTYTGSTTISAGTLEIASAGRLGGGNYSQNITNNGVFLYSGTNNQTLSGIISGTGALTHNTTGGNTTTLTLTGNNTYTGATTVSAGILNIQHANALGGSANGTTVASGAVLQLQGGITIASEALTLNGSGVGNGGALVNSSGNNEWAGNITIGSALTRIHANTGTTLTISGNITNNAAGALHLQGPSGANIIVSGIISGNGSLNTNTTNFPVSLTLSGNNTYTGKSVLNSGTISINSIKDVGAGASSLGAPTTTANGQIDLGSGTGGIATLRYTGTGDSSNRTINLASTTANQIIDQSGTGTLRFTSNFTAGGAGSKTLILQGSTAGIGEIAGAVVNNNSTNTTSLTKNGTGTWILSGANTYTGATTINAGTLQIGNGSSTGSLSASSAITNNGTLVFNRSGTVTQGTDFANGISGTGNLTQAGSGTLALGGTNTYTGLTTISAGNLSISSVSALGSTSGINLANNTALIYNGGAGDLTRDISVTGTTGSTGTIRNSGTGLLTLSGALSKNGTTLTLAGGSNGITVSGVISGSSLNSDLVIDGGITTLTNANTYNGPTFLINGATLNANAVGALPTSTRSAISIDTTGTGSSTLALGASQSIASLTGNTTSTVTLGTNTLTLGTTSGNTTYAGLITGASNSALVKDGESTQVLTGDNTGFTGNTTVSGGTLQAAAAGAMGNSTVINVNGGSFLVTAENAVSDSTNINLGGGRMAVSGTFNENVGLLTLSADSVIDLNNFTGILRFGGVGSWAPSANLAIWNWNGTPLHNPGNLPPSGGTRHVVFASNSGLDPYLDRISFYSGSGSGFVGNAFEDSFSDPSFSGTEIIAVPEPETYLTGVILLLGGIIYLRRQAKLREGHRPAWPKYETRKVWNHSRTPSRQKTAQPTNRERGEHGRLDRERNSCRNLINGQTPSCAHPARMSLNHEYPE